MDPKEILERLLELDKLYLPESQDEDWSIEQIDEFIAEFKKLIRAYVVTD